MKDTDLETVIMKRKMKKINHILFGLFILALIGTGCDSLLKVDSERFMYPENHRIDSPNDSIYSMVGIFTKLEKLADRYVLLGELRGDLMAITENAGLELREINDLDISADNPYNAIEDYYSVINHCNFLINNIDTALVSSGEKSLLKEYAAAKAIRAWTYMQIALNYGTAKYYTEPLLTIKASQADFTEYSINDMVPLLIQDLEPLKHVESPGSISLGVDMESGKLFFPIPLLLGDLYLWNGQYENAAREYYSLIEDKQYVISGRYTSTWTVDNGVFVERDPQEQSWPDLFILSNGGEQITLIAGTTQTGDTDVLNKLSGDTYEIAPSSVAINNWDVQTYYYNENATIPGDLRGNIGSYFEQGSIYTSAYASSSSNITGNMISKYPIIHRLSLAANSSNFSTKSAMLYRVATLYLRYAEAVNRVGKPNLAFAVLKYGMNPEELAYDTIVPRHEKYSDYTDSTGTFIDYVNFNELAFEQNIGIHARGCGNVNRGTDYRIPSLGTLQDSIDYVEDKIIEELALETAFEGNRFQDLMRIAMRRNDPAYLADKVAAKHSGNEQAIRSRLMDENNWYLKH